MNGENPQQVAPEKDGWQFKPDEQSASTNNQQPPVDFMPQANTEATSQVAPDSTPEIVWSASEFIVHEKNLNWYIGFFAAAIIIEAIIYFWTQDTLSVVAGIVIFILLGISASRKPRVVEYSVDQSGVSIAHRSYYYSDFKSFGVLQDGAFSSIVLVPLKRFSPPLTLYFAPEDQEKIILVLSSHLPYSPVTIDLIDNLLRKVHL